MRHTTTRFVAVALLTFACFTTIARPAEAAGANRLVPKNYATIGSALNASESGDTITVFPGTFSECVTISGLSEISVIGKHGAVIDVAGCPAGVTIENGVNIVFGGFTLTGATLQGIAVQTGANDVLINKVTIATDQQDPALSSLEVGVSIVGADDVLLRDVTISGATLHAVHVMSATRTVVKQSTISDGIGDGVRVDLGTNAKIADNVMWNLLGPAIFFFHDGGDGMTGGGGESIVVRNKILDSPGGGIVIGGTNNLIQKNAVADSGGTGITALANGGGSIYRKNKVNGSAEAGILAAGTGDTFEKNTVLGSHQDGIAVVGSMNVLTKSRVVNAMGSGFAVALTASDNTFEDCGSVRAGADGFLVAGSANTFTKAKASGSGGLDLNDPAGGATTNVYTDCTFKSSNVP
jgi:hypothetical protein